MSARPTPILTAEDLAFRYQPDQAWLFRHLSFELAPGDALAILGPNGRGKTTLLRCLLGLARPTAGRVALDGRTGHVPQSLEAAFPFTCRDMVVMGRAGRLGLFAAPGHDDWRAADRALARLGLERFAARPFNALSGGERQLVLIARALAAEARILILDEPTSALDFRNQEIILRTLRELVGEGTLGLVFTSHDPQHALALASHGLLLTGPGMHRLGPAEEVFDEGPLSELYGLSLRRLSFSHGQGAHDAIVPVFG